MTKQSTHSQDYDRKHGVDHDVIDKAALEEAFVDRIRKDADGEDLNRVIPLPGEKKDPATQP